MEETLVHFACSPKRVAFRHHLSNFILVIYKHAPLAHKLPIPWGSPLPLHRPPELILIIIVIALKVVEETEKYRRSYDTISTHIGSIL